MSDYNVKDAVGLAFDGNVAEFKNAIDSLLMDKVYDAVEIKRHEVSANYMASEEPTEETEND
jgi:hypothetical protein